MSTTDEVWLPVVGFEGYYEVSNYGDVRSIDRQVTDGRWFKGKIRKPYPSTSAGHLMVSLYRGSEEHKWMVHRLVAFAFIGHPPEGKPYALHGDGNQLNNHVSNLRWGSQKENMADAMKHGTTTPRGYREDITECPKGHEYTTENTFYRKNRTNRECRECMRLRARDYYWRKKNE